VPAIGADFYYSNLHKWGFAPHTSTAMWGREDVLRSTSHAVVSWHWRQGLKMECTFPGTRDFSPLLASPAAVQYLQGWRAGAAGATGATGGATDDRGVLQKGEEDEGAAAFNRRGALAAAIMLREAWGTEPAQPDETVASMAMVQVRRRTFL
jgi:hypothetical protein